MIIHMETAHYIQKETLSEMHFPGVDVLTDKEAINTRSHDLRNALHLGNVDHTKVKIFFLTNLGFQNQVETTVWAVTEESVCLKGYLYIPIRAIQRIEF